MGEEVPGLSVHPLHLLPRNSWDMLPRRTGNLEGKGDITLWNLIDEFSRLPELAQYIVTMNVDSHSQNK